MIYRRPVLFATLVIMFATVAAYANAECVTLCPSCKPFCAEKP